MSKCVSIAQAHTKSALRLFGPSIFPENSHLKWLLSSIPVHFDCAGSHKNLRCDPGPRHFC